VEAGSRVRRYLIITAICRTGAIAALVAITAGCASGQSVETVTTTATAPAATAPVSSNSQTVSAAAAAKPAPKPQTFRGVGTENLGTITASVDSTLRWSCPSCGSANFQILTSDVGKDIAVNGLDQTSGQTVVTAGSYHGVTINTEGGSWALRIAPGNSTQTSEAPPAVSSQPSQAQPAVPSQPAGSAGSDAVRALNNYWQAISNGDFQAAYGYLGPGQEAESTWISSHQAAGIQSATFSGTATYVGSATATVHVDSLQTQDQASGCRTWSGDYQMVEQGGAWLIAKAEISPSSCSTSAPPASTTGTPAADFCTTHTCIPNFPNGHGYIVQCQDGQWSQSGGLAGACSDHGGETSTTYP
jgi:hypothetical protein